MEYKRIHTPQSGMISPSKIRMKLMGIGNQRKKDVNNTLLASTSSPDEWGIQFEYQVEDSSVSNSSASAVHPLKSVSMEGESLDYDSNASSSSFEFHKGERPVSSFSRPTSYKWNDAHKWIVNKQCSYPPLGPRMPPAYHSRLQPATATQISLDWKDDSSGKVSFPPCLNAAGDPAIREVSMRDMGTEMTPVPSQEPSRTATPVGATTPLRSSTSSLPRAKELSEQERKLNTRREIVALGVHLGKMNIAAWASKGVQQQKSVSDLITDLEDLGRLEYEKCAAAWEEAEKSKHAARLKREEIKIEAWECKQKLKLKEEMGRMEAKLEKMRAHAQAKMMKKSAMTRKQSDQKRMAAEARKNRLVERTAARGECIRQTGRIPPSVYICCSLF